MKRKIKSNLLFNAVILLFAALCVIIIITLQVNLNKIKTERDILESKFAEYSEKVDELEYNLSLTEEEYIEKYAREVLGYHKQGEIVFKDDE